MVQKLKISKIKNFKKEKKKINEQTIPFGKLTWSNSSEIFCSIALEISMNLENNPWYNEEELPSIIFIY